MAKKREKEERRKAREEKRRNKRMQKAEEKQRKEEEEEEQRLARKIAMEEQKLLIAQRKLESIRLLDELFERIKVSGFVVWSDELWLGGLWAGYVKSLTGCIQWGDMRDISETRL